MKKGVSELTSLLVAIIIIVASLIVLFLFFDRLETTENIDKQACRTSVEARAAFNLGNLFEPGRKVIPLNCKTEKICISDSGENCDAVGFRETEKNPIKEIKIENSDAKIVVLDTISESLLDCHSMLGEGKLDFLPSGWSSRNYCLICSRIALDEETRNNIGEISYMQLYQHLQQKQTPKEQSYLEFIYGARSALEMANILENMKEQINEETGKQTVSSIEEFKLDLKHENGNAIIVQMSPKGNWNEWISYISGSAGAVGAVIVVGAVIAAPFTLGGSTALIGVGVALIGGGVSAATGIPDWGGTVLDGEDRILLGSGPIIAIETPNTAKYALPTLYNYNVEVLQGLNCNEFELAP